MRMLARTSLGLLGLGLIAPAGVMAQDATSSLPSGYQAVAAPDAAPAPAPAMAPAMAPAAPAAEAPHKHKARTLCAKCAAKMKAQGPNPVAMPPGRVVGCAHSKNGACPECQAALNMPGQFVMAGGQPAAMAAQPAEAPGRAVASSGPSPKDSVYVARTARTAPVAPATPSYGAEMSEPAPVGVVQANFSQGAPAGAPAAYAPQQPMAPGRAVAESNAGRDPYQAKSGPFPRPHILGHLFGWSGMGAEKAEARAQKKAEAHAMITYDENGNAPVDEIPASMVFGKKR